MCLVVSTTDENAIHSFTGCRYFFHVACLAFLFTLNVLTRTTVVKLPMWPFKKKIPLSHFPSNSGCECWRFFSLNTYACEGRLGSSVKCLPSAPAVILGSWDRAPSEGSPPFAPPPTWTLFFSLSNKWMKSFKKKNGRNTASPEQVMTSVISPLPVP